MRVLGIGAGLVGLVALLVGCASPGPPRAPSLELPGVVKDLAAVRRGNAVVLRFTLPEQTTDKLPEKAQTLRATVCRGLGSSAQPCNSLMSKIFPAKTNGSATVATITDELPVELATGTPRVLVYRVELLNEQGRTAGFSDAAYAAAGAGPAAVESLSAQGSRDGVLLRWADASAEAGEVVLRRQDLRASTGTVVDKPRPERGPRTAAHAAGKPGPTAKVVSGKAAEDEPGVVWLSTSVSHAAFQGELETVNAPPPQDMQRGVVLDATAEPEVPYRYAAERRRVVQLGGRSLEMRSALSGPVEITLHEVYPPAAPVDLTAASFAQGAGMAVDLIWQPVDDPGLAGYNVYRERVDGTGKVRLNQKPVALPAFHDVPGIGQFRYSVTAVDAKGNESAAAVTTVDVAGT